MVKVTIKKNDEYIEEFIIQGHTNSNESGEFDLVCAGVSAIVIGILNSLDKMVVKTKVKDGFVNIQVKKFTKNNEFILNILKTSLLTMEKSYRKYISVMEEKL